MTSPPNPLSYAVGEGEKDDHRRRDSHANTAPPASITTTEPIAKSP